MQEQAGEFLARNAAGVEIHESGLAEEAYVGARIEGHSSSYVYVTEPTRRGDVTIFELEPLEHVLRHSPDGFSWGYGGSGPSELARCILLDALPEDLEKVDRNYQEFKREHIAGITAETWVLTKRYVLEWLEGRPSSWAE